MVHHPCQNFPLPSGCKAQLPVLARERQREMERRAGTDSAFRPDPAAVRFHNAARDCQSEADATPVAATTLPEFLEQTIEVSWAMPGPESMTTIAASVSRRSRLSTMFPRAAQTSGHSPPGYSIPA